MVEQISFVMKLKSRLPTLYIKCHVELHLLWNLKLNKNATAFGEKIHRQSDILWALPIVMAKMKDGSYRFCLDYRKLNGVTIKDSHPLPRKDDSLDVLGEMDFGRLIWILKINLNSIHY